MAQIGEAVVIAHLEETGGEINRVDPDWLQNLFVFPQTGVRFGGGADQAVETEVSVVGLVAKVAAIGEPFRPVIREPANALIFPVPDKAALEARVLVDGVPIFFQVAGAVTHRMGIFTHDNRAVIWLLGQRNDMGYRRVHGAEDIGDGGLLRRVVVDRAGWFPFAQPGRHCIMVGAITRLIAQRPADDTGVVFVPFDHVAHAIHKVIFPNRVFRQPIPNTVGFDIGFVQHIEAVLVTEFVPAGLVGIVGGAHGVEVKLFHQLDVAQHVLLADHMASIRFMLVTIDAFDQQRFAVDTKLPVHDLDLAHANFAAFHFNDLPGRILERQEQRVEIGLFI